MASASSDYSRNSKYDVFISFRGSDVRQGFLSHLQKALLDEKIEAFVDEQLERGKEISASLLQKIEESNLAVVIFSQNYAYSEWCLQELMKIAECRTTGGQTVIPVFYGVDPSHVQDLTGRYGHAMARHRTQFDELLVDSWGDVLMRIASLSGLVSSNFKTECSLIEEIIHQAHDKLNCLYPHETVCEGGLVGINSRVENIMLLLSGPEDAYVIGIWGEGSIGKTTLAEATFDRISAQFDSYCFVRNVREKAEKFTTDAIQNEVVSKLFGTSDSSMTRKRLSRKKVILVLDDLSDMDQIKSIIRYRFDFGRGSRIIVTSRDRHLLKRLGAKIYAVDKLNQLEAFQLFCLNAFSKKVPPKGYFKLCEKAVKYAQGLPLALEVLGSNLFQRSAEEWEDELEKLQGMSDQKIHKILRRSYEGLCDVEKEIFLDIAYFFEGAMREAAERILDVHGSKIGISRLAEKALISIDSRNQIKMHDLIRQMAKDIVCEEKTPGKRRWLWDPEDIYYVLTEETGTEAVRGIFLDMYNPIRYIEKINLSPIAFRKMYDLKYLIFRTSNSSDAPLCVPQGLEYLPQQLRYLHWTSYPSKSLPFTSSLVGKLVNLMMHGSQLEELWNGVQNLPNLRCLSLSGSKKLIKVPDLSTASNLEVLHLDYCASLVEIPSLRNLCKLSFLNLAHCSRLKSLPDDICYLKSLSLLEISQCKSLHGLPHNVGNLKSLVILAARGSGIKELPESFCSLQKVKALDVGYCENLHRLPRNLGNLRTLTQLVADNSGLKELPDSICNLKKCRTLDVSDCVNLQCLPKNLGNLESLRNFNVDGSCINELQDTICSLKACTSFNVIWHRKNLHQLPQNLGNLESEEYLHANRRGIKEVPFCLNDLRGLMDVALSGCEGLVLAPLTGHFPRLTHFTLNYCGISEFPIGLCNLTSLSHLNLDGNNFESIPESIHHLVNLHHLDLNDCKKLKYLPESIKLLPALGYLAMAECTSLGPNQLSDITDHFMMQCIEGRRQRIPSLGHPGSEVPEKMKHKGECGSSLSFCFKLLQRVGSFDVSLYACIVVDRPMRDVIVEGKFMDENGRIVRVGREHFRFLRLIVESKHMVFETIRLKGKKLVKGRKYTAEIEFQYQNIDPSPVGGDLSCEESMSSDGMLKFGVNPLFAHQIIE